MFERLKRFSRERRNAHAFAGLPPESRRLVFYSEGPDYWVHFEPIIRHLWEDYGQRVTYLTSDENDWVLSRPPQGLDPYYIGEGTVRTMLFASLQAEVMVMTMPDLQVYHIKRSPYPVHYVYVYHSLLSCHMVYRPRAFDHFDTIFCVGPHQVEEIRAWEAQIGLKEKTLIEHGYGRLEALIKELGQQAEKTCADDGPPRILIAPSWGDHALLERHGGEFIGPLLDAGYRVTLRPHPQTRRLHPEILEQISDRYGGRKNFTLEKTVAPKSSLIEANVMVSDWSGAALEFAFALERPVLFVDVPRKVNNPDYESLGIEPIEVRIREQIGRVLPEDRLETMAEVVGDLLQAWKSPRDEIAALRKRYVFNLGNSGEVGARELMRILNSPRGSSSRW